VTSGLAPYDDDEDPPEWLPPLDHTIRDLPKGFGQKGFSGHGNGVKRRKEFLNALAHGMTVDEALSHVGSMSRETIKSWRMRDPVFKGKMEEIILERTIRDDPALSDVDISFEEFRWTFLKRRTPGFQTEITQAYQNTPPGNILLILIPPEHGKTTLFEDYACYKLAVNPNYRITVGSEASSLSEKILGRVKNRMEPEGPYPRFVEHWGPFVPQLDTGRKTRQPWGSKWFNVAKKAAHDERDYSMVALGFGSQIRGTRTDHLHVDDPQSIKTLNQTEQMLENFRNDWLTRPGERGITTINGTRVGPGDFYEELIRQFEDMPGIFQLIKMPAIRYDQDLEEHIPLWPKRGGHGYTMEMLDRIRRKTGEEAWARNYMMEPRAKSMGTFTEDMVDRCKNYQRRAGEVAVEGAPFVITIDPSLIGVNCIMSMQLTPEKIYVVDIMEDTQLQRNEQIMARLEAMCLKIRGRGGAITDCIVEAKNFQLGLARDDRLREIADVYRFNLREHLTGVNKYAEDVGVPTMATSFMREYVDLPYADDAYTRELTNALSNQLLNWRPFAKGNVLRQDQVMALWFGWIFWDMRRRQNGCDASSFKMHGLPWQPTNSGLIVPTRPGSPFFAGAR
jgi:hypothetical protein